jgi:hypothetical protein
MPEQGWVGFWVKMRAKNINKSAVLGGLVGQKRIG